MKHQIITIQVSQADYFLNRGKDQVAAYFGEIHPNIIKKNRYQNRVISWI